MARVLIGVSGGIAAYKAVELARLATLAGHGVRVVMTRSAQRFVGAETFAGITGAPVLFEEFDPDPARGAYPGEPAPEHDPISHLALAENADVVVVAPASANTIAKLAAGICDSMLTTSFLAATAPRLVAPAMNARMWEDAATQANVALLASAAWRCSSPPRASSPPAGSGAPGACRSRATILAAIDARLGGADVGDLERARASWSPPAAPASRSTRCASSATARAAGWGSRSPPPRHAAARR